MKIQWQVNATQLRSAPFEIFGGVPKIRRLPICRVQKPQDFMSQQV
jgi:hypothetical protein